MKLCWITLSSVCVLAACSTSPRDASAPDASAPDEINHVLGLTQSMRVRPAFTGDIHSSLNVNIEIDGDEHELALELASVRSSRFQLFVQGEDGAMTQVKAPPATTVRGSVVGIPNSVVTGSLLADGLHARVALSTDNVFWTEPLARLAQGTNEYIVYRDFDVIESPKTCGLDDVIHGRVEDTGLVVRAETAQAEGLAIAELAVDADYEFFSAWGSVEATVARMEAVVAAINVQYEAEVGIRHVISAAIVRSNQADPYSSTDPTTMLQNELRPEWLQNHGDIQRDIVHLFSGKNIDGSTIGIAYTGAVCSSFGFGLSQSNFTSNFACVTDLAAHEIGHNWGAGHCNCPGNTMNPSLTCANTFDTDVTVPTIVNHRNTRNCLTLGDTCPEDPNKTEPGQCGCGVADGDGDGDGVADCDDGCPSDINKAEPGQCGCGVADSHSDGDGVVDCLDGCPIDGNKTAPGACGCGVTDTDSDSDGVADCNDGCPDDPTTSDIADCTAAACGDGSCDAGESSCSCPEDCGEPPTTEIDCSNGFDSDCDGQIDCADSDCVADEACVEACRADGDGCDADGECCSGQCRGNNGSEICKSVSGSEECGQVGASCNNNSECCTRECGEDGLCKEPEDGVLDPPISDPTEDPTDEPTDDDPAEDPAEEDPAANPTDDESGIDANVVTGGCTVTDGGQGSQSLLWMMLALLLCGRGRSRRRRA